jgi:hypothetical protein
VNQGQGPARQTIHRLPGPVLLDGLLDPLVRVAPDGRVAAALLAVPVSEQAVVVQGAAGCRLHGPVGDHAGCRVEVDDAQNVAQMIRHLLKLV